MFDKTLAFVFDAAHVLNNQANQFCTLFQF